MRHKVREFKAGRAPHQIRAMIPSQVCSLIQESRIKTTVVKAKETRRLAEKMMTLGKKGTLHDRRRAISKLHNKVAVKQLFDEIAPKYMDRAGGYTRIIRLGARRGDAAELCYLEWVEETLTKKSAKQEPVKKEAPVEVEAAEVVEAEVEETKADAPAEDASEAPAEETPAEEAPAAKKAAKEKKKDKK